MSVHFHFTQTHLNQGTVETEPSYLIQLSQVLSELEYTNVDSLIKSQFKSWATIN